VARGVKVFFDGGLRPAGMEYAVVLAGRSIVRQGLGAGTSMDAEWLALIAALQLAVEQTLPDIILLGDAAAVIAQAGGTARCPSPYADHLRIFEALAASAPPFRLRYVKRSQNLAGIALARLHDR
jgi:ribonuclease HI